MSSNRNTKNSFILFKMTKSIHKLLPVLLCIVASSIWCGGQSFAVEQKLPKLVNLPDGIYKILLKNNDINDILNKAKGEGISAKAIKKQFFQAAKVNINDDRLTDLLVKGQSYLQGMNTTHFWIFKNTKTGYILVFETVTFGLKILKKKSKGYRIIESALPGGDKAFFNYFRFDGQKYVHSWGKTEDI